MDAPGLEEIRRRFDDAPMSAAQIRAVGLTVILSALDGYDVLSVTFAAPAITAAWGIGKAQLGIVLASGLAGMALGSFFLAPLADVFGRRGLVLLSLGLMAAGMLMSALSHSMPELAGWRVLTGLGIGTCVAVINPLAAEFSNARRRPLALAMMAMGYPAGGTIGGLVAAALLHFHGWPAVFLAGFAAALILIPLVAVLLPESPAFLLGRDKPGSLARANAVLVRCGQAPIAALPPRAAAASRGYAAVFAPAQLGTTVRLTAVNLLYAIAAYYVLSWLPQMVADAGFPPSTASLVAAVANIAGIAGGLLLGSLARAFGVERLTAITMIGLGLSMLAFGYTPPSLALLMLVAGISGYFLFSGVAGFYATLATAFAAEARASGSGFVIGVGRIGSAVAPLLAGYLFAGGLGRGTVSAAFGACAVLAGILLAWPRRFRKAGA